MKLNKKKFSPVFPSLISFFLVLIILIFFQILPQNIKTFFILNTSFLSPLSIYFNHFVHLDFTHFFGNFITLLIIFSISLFLAIKTNSTKEFNSIFLTSILLSPFLLSFLIILLAKINLVQQDSYLGFSGINSFLIGSFLLLLFFKEAKINSLIVCINFILSLTFIFLIAYFSYFWQILKTNYILPFTFVIMLTILYFYASSKNLIKFLKEQKQIEKEIKLVIYLSPFLILFSLIIPFFPLFPYQNNSVIGIHVHYIGFILGLSITGTIFKIYKSKS